ncbi:MAG: LuxR C-terminal-related transcriptional regulator [Oceanobacter sp.]
MTRPTEHSPSCCSSSSLATLIDHVRLASFPARLAEHLASLCLFDTCLMVVYHPSHKPCLLHTESSEMSDALQLYLQRCYLIDPFYNAIQNDGFVGVGRLSQLAPDSFRHSEYYQICYREFGLADEIVMLVPLDDGYSFGISLGRKSSLGSITRAELNRLQELYSVIAALIRQFWLSNADGYKPLRQSPSETGQNQSSLARALRTFGKGVLTPREQQIIALVLQGHSSQSIADQLGISLGTVKVHRKNIHGRLNTSTQSDIFTLFLNHLSEMDIRVVA